MSGISDVSRITNTEFWDMARRFSPSFASHTAEGTSVEFNEKGYEAIRYSDSNVLNEFFGISMKISLQLLSTSRAKNPFIDKGLLQVFEMGHGAYDQRINVHSVKPVSPAYNGLEDGDSVDPYQVRKADIDERFFGRNFNYQSWITVQDFQLKTMFINEYGMGDLLSGIMQALANGYTIQEYENIKECMNAAINSTKTPLKDTQIQNIGTFDEDAPSTAELTAFILRVKNIATAMNAAPQTGAYNALGFETVVDPSDMVLVMRAGVKNAIEVGLMVGAFNPDFLTLPFEIIETEDFGGVHYTRSNAALSPVYDRNGTERGLIESASIPQSGLTAYKAKSGTYAGKWVADINNVQTLLAQPTDDNVAAVDPNADVLGLIMQKGAIFESSQNPYTVEPIRNPRGMYDNYWANRPNTGINYDAAYSVVAITKTATTTMASPVVGS